MSRPDVDYIDNEVRTMGEVIREEIEWASINLKGEISLSIATGYFHPDVFKIIGESLKKLDKFRLLIGAEPLPERMQNPSRNAIHGDKLVYDSKKVKEAISEGLDYDRDMLETSKETSKSLQEMLEFFKKGLENGSIEVRKYSEGFLHGKAYVFHKDASCVVGSSNLTPSGLMRNKELNLGRRDGYVVCRVSNWFEELWSRSEPFDIVHYYEEKFVLSPPYLIWLKTLWELYCDELKEEGETECYNGNICLTDFQSDGLHRAKKIMEKYNGVIIADSVGLGKTYLAGKLIEETAIKKRQRVLIIAPAALRDTTWKQFMSKTDTRVECKSFQEIMEGKLDAKASEYSLIVIDEAAALRNEGTEQSKAVRDLLKGTPPKKVMMLTATPVNNSLWDLYALLTFFIKNDAVFTDKGILSMKKKFQEAESESPFSLSPNVLFDILDETTVRRTRRFINKWYQNDTIDVDGEKRIVVFPKTRVDTINYEFSSEVEGVLEEFTKIIDNDREGLTLARYGWKKYATDPKLYDGSDVQTQIKLSGLIRSSMLKRLESSLFSFSETVNKIINVFEKFIMGLEAGKVLDADNISSVGDDLTDDQIVELVENMSNAPSSSGLDVNTLIKDIRHDILLLKPIAEKLEIHISNQENDPKLQALLMVLKKILVDSKNNPLSSDFKKVLIFSYYEDTVRWIESWLLKKINEDADLSQYKGRIASVSGSGALGGTNRNKIINGFSPLTTINSDNPDDNRYDVLITTDVLSEGQNLQQCANIINYDLPWNPMRLVQRQGRIDRIGSEHEYIYSRCFMPTKKLDELLNLEQRIKEKIAKAAQSIGLEEEIIPGGARSDIVFAEIKEEITKIASGNAEIFENAGEGIHAGSGEEFRRELQNAIDKGIISEKKLNKMPWGVGTCIEKGQNPGFFFCAKVGKNVFLRFIPNNGNIVLQRKKLECLNNVVCKNDSTIADRSYPADVIEAWERAREDIFNEWTKGTDQKNVLPEVRKKFRKMADIVEQYHPEGCSLEDIERYGKTLRASWPPRIEKEFPALPEKSLSVKKMQEISLSIIKKCNELGLEPYDVELLPRINISDVKLVCWIKAK